MYYDIEEEARRQEPDIDEELQKLEDCKALATQIYESSEKTKEDYEKYNYKLLAIAENKNRLLRKKLVKYEIENINLKSDVDYFRGFCRYSGAEKLFLYLLCGLASPVLFLPAVLSSLLFPKENGRYHLGPFYENHPHIYAIICFLLVAGIVAAIKFIK